MTRDEALAFLRERHEDLMRWPWSEELRGAVRVAFVRQREPGDDDDADVDDDGTKLVPLGRMLEAARLGLLPPPPPSGWLESLTFEERLAYAQEMREMKTDRLLRDVQRQLEKLLEAKRDLYRAGIATEADVEIGKLLRANLDLVTDYINERKKR